MSSSHGLRFILTGESPLFTVGETLHFMLSLHDLIPNDVSMKVRMMMMMERMFKVRNDEELKNVMSQYHTDEVSANNGHNQIRLTYNDFLYDSNKGKSFLSSWITYIYSLWVWD